jgi:hypothetical protein
MYPYKSGPNNNNGRGKSVHSKIKRTFLDVNTVTRYPITISYITKVQVLKWSRKYPFHETQTPIIVFATSDKEIS